MPTVDVVVSCPIFDSFRVQQVAGLFDLPAAEKGQERFSAEIPDLEADWRIGLVLGPSGSGKSTIAKRLFGDCLYGGAAWPEDRALVDCLGDRPIKEIIGILTAVGLSSPPSWIKPYHVLSCGERFRCDLAPRYSKRERKPLTGTASVAFRSALVKKWGLAPPPYACDRENRANARCLSPFFHKRSAKIAHTFAERKATKHKPPEGGTPAAAERQRLPVVCFDEIHQRGGSKRCPDRLGRDRKSRAARAVVYPFRGGDLPRRRGGMARARLDLGHGDRQSRREAASAAAHPAGNRSLEA